MPRQPRIFALATALLLGVGGAWLPARAAALDCAHIQYSQQVDRCAQQDKELADSALNQSYQALLERVHQRYPGNLLQEQEYLGKLKNAQRAWIKYRDSTCVLEAVDVEPGKPAHTTLINRCVTRLSNERSHYLDQLLVD
ncbi:lysozyme inhibitor LprI family protein [Pseudomonas piscis]|uniref:Lysozyme inhibitor LprI family protein n=1 Tax=Pseudomonas piscis TaxID=2614538 RepID=A0ABY9NEY4_9PSED|nr:lysozyme inhibitor LprI family protein [Pseudomonas piscis]WMN16885.1 lysozyme inhibitor LprI family protein [Pseudomonas piscis]